MIKSLERVSPSEYLWRVVDVWTELARQFLADRELMSFGPDDRLLVDVDGKTVRSMLVWCYYEDDRTARVLLGYTSPDCRGRGLYTALYNQMKKEAKALGAVKTLGGIMAGNQTMLRLAERQGRKLVSHWVEERL